jgi:hypothetical protein
MPVQVLRGWDGGLPPKSRLFGDPREQTSYLKQASIWLCQCERKGCGGIGGAQQREHCMGPHI